MRRNIRERVAGARAVPDLRPRSLHRRRRRRPAVLDDGRLHDVGHVSVRAALPARATSAINYMRNSVKAIVDAYDGTVDVLRLRHRAIRSSPRIARIFPTLFKDASAMPPTLRSARALSGADAGDAGGGLRPVSHDRSRRVLQPRGSLDASRAKSASNDAREQAAQADGAELRADEAAGREERRSSSRSCRSRRRTATT